MREWAAIFRSRRMAVVFLLGFSSGLPNMLIGQTLQQWAYDQHLDIKKLATFATLKFPFAIKWAWAPLLDRYRVPFLGRRRGWMLVFQIGLLLGLGAMATLDPGTGLPMLLSVALFVSIMSASQDIVIDAYNVEVLEPPQRAAGSASYILGYRTAMLVSGSLTLVMADHLVWNVVYAIMAALMLVGIVTVFYAEEPPPSPIPRSIIQSVYKPFVEVVRRYRGYVIFVLLFCATFKFGEQFAQVVSQPFYRDIGFTKTEIGLMSKAIGFAAFAIGGGIGGTLVAKHGLRKMVVVFGCLAAFVHLGYLLISVVGHNLYVYGVTLFLENLSFAMGTTALNGAEYSFCSPAYAATQMALLSSLSGLAGSIFGPFAGQIVASVGYTNFFLIVIAMAVPGIIFAYFATSPTIEARGSASVSSTASPG
jgi:PAT family beta-lactamase induction signal transducer AmpG